MHPGQAVFERYEYKYRIPSALVEEVRRAVRKYCEPDPASRSAPYLISSLYLDSPDRALYRMTADGQAQRLKLRIRRYVDGPFFLELKRRVKAVVLKRRVAIEARCWPGVLLDPAATVPSRSASEERTIQEFIVWSMRIGAAPAAVVRYAREAFVSRADHYARVTFDTRLEALRSTSYEVPISEAGWIRFDGDDRFAFGESGVVLELKCTTAVPLWMADLVERFGLQPTGFSKYANAIRTLAAHPRDLGMAREPSRRIAGGMWTDF